MNWKVVLAIMVCNVVLMSASYTMLVPFLPLYLRNELGTPEESLNMWSGAIFAISFAVCAVMAPIWGKMSDSKGKKLMLIRSSALIAVTYFCGALVQTPGQLFMVRVLQGFAAGLWPASLALTSAYTPQNKVGVSMGVMQSALITGNIIGPLFGGLLAESFGIRASFFIAGAALCIITAITVIFIKEPPKSQDERTKVEATYGDLLRRDGVGIILLAAGLTTMVIMLLQPIMTLYISELRHSDDHLILISGMVFSLSGIAGAIAAPLWGRQGQAVGFYRTMLAALIASGILIAAQFIPDTLIPFAALQFCVGLGFSGIFPSANAMIVNVTSPLERGSAFGMLFSSQQIGGAIGPLLGGAIATWINLSVIFLLSGLILLVIALLVYLKAPQSLKAPPQKVAKETPSHDLIDSIKKQAAEEIASGADLSAQRQKNKEPEVPVVTGPDKDAAAGTGSVVSGTIYGFGEEKRYLNVTAPDEKEAVAALSGTASEHESKAHHHTDKAPVTADNVIAASLEAAAQKSAAPAAPSGPAAAAQAGAALAAASTAASASAGASSASAGAAADSGTAAADHIASEVIRDITRDDDMNDEQLSSVLDQVMQGSPGCDPAAAARISDLRTSSDNTPSSDAASEQDTATAAATDCSDAPAR